jgi:hypothetical protein
MQPKVWLKRMKKKLNVESIQSELRGGSAFFPGYKGPDSPPPPKEEAKQVKTAESPTEEKKSITHHETTEGVPPTVPLPVRVPVPHSLPLVPKIKRPIKQRQPFDIYEDQYEQLKSISEAERGFVNGRGMSQMVREALDLYLARQTSSKK